MTAVLACDSFLALRNVRYADLGTRLGGRVLVLVDPNQIEGAREAAPPGVEIEPLLDFDPWEPPLRPLLVRSYYTRKAYYDPVSFWLKLRAMSHRGHPNPGVRRAASVLKARATLATHRVAGAAGRAVPRRRRFVEALLATDTAALYRTRLERLGADLVAGFSPEGTREMVLVEAARAANIATAVMIRSRDNLAAKIAHLPSADAYFVWSDALRAYMVRMYPEIDPATVHVTGSPQFDRHLDPAARLSREDFFGRLGLDPDRPLVVYGCSTPGLIEHEVEIAQHLADAAGSGLLARRAQLLVRAHPRAFGSSHALLHHLPDGVAIWPPPGSAPHRGAEHERDLVRLVVEDGAMHLSTLAYQDVQVNVSGTMTIDSAIVDTPIVNVAYDVADVAAGVSVRRFYARADWAPVVRSGGVRLARTPEECIETINRYLREPSLDAEGRRRIRETECGPLDGRAGERIAEHIRALARAGEEARARA